MSASLGFVARPTTLSASRRKAWKPYPGAGEWLMCGRTWDPLTLTVVDVEDHLDFCVFAEIRLSMQVPFPQRWARSAATAEEAM